MSSSVSDKLDGLHQTKDAVFFAEIEICLQYVNAQTLRIYNDCAAGWVVDWTQNQESMDHDRLKG